METLPCFCRTLGQDCEEHRMVLHQVLPLVAQAAAGCGRWWDTLWQTKIAIENPHFEWAMFNS